MTTPSYQPHQPVREHTDARATLTVVANWSPVDRVTALAAGVHVVQSGGAALRENQIDRHAKRVGNRLESSCRAGLPGALDLGQHARRYAGKSSEIAATQATPL